MSKFLRSDVTFLDCKAEGLKALVSSDIDLDIRIEKSDFRDMQNVVDIVDGSSRIDFIRNRTERVADVIKVNNKTIKKNVSVPVKKHRNISPKVNSFELIQPLTKKSIEIIIYETNFKREIRELLNLEAQARFSRDYRKIKLIQYLKANLRSSQAELKKFDLDKV